MQPAKAAATEREFAAEDSGRHRNAKCWLDFAARKSSLASGKLTRLRVATRGRQLLLQQNGLLDVERIS
jgi:hypothetical protein